MASYNWPPENNSSAVLVIGSVDTASPSANGANIVGNDLVLQSASTSFPGLVNNTTQSFSGNKTFTGTITASNFSGSFSGTSSGTNTGDVSIGTANGLSLVGQVLSLALSSTSTTGSLSSTDWNTFNNKQAAGNYITDLTGDVVATGPGSVSATIQPLAVTNSKIANATIDLTTKVTGILPIANGGTGSATTSQNFAFIGPTSGSGAPSFRGLVSGDIPDLSGTYLPLAGGSLNLTANLSLNNGNLNLTNFSTLNGFDTSSVTNLSTLGIRAGATSVDTPITILNTGGVTNIVKAEHNNGLKFGYVSYGSNGPFATPTASVLGDSLQFIGGAGYGTTGYPAGFPDNSTGILDIVAQGTFTDSSMPTSVDIKTTPSGSITPVLALRVQPTGQLSMPAFYTSAGVLHNDASGNVTSSAVSLTADVSGVLPTANGGTGLSSSGTSGNVLTSNGSVWVSSPPASSAPITASYNTTAGQAIPNGTDTVVNYDNQLFDGTSIVTTGASWHATVVTAGAYYVNAKVSFTGIPGGTIAYYLAIRQNGTIVHEFEDEIALGGSNSFGVQGLLNCVATDTIDVVVNQKAGGTLSLNTTASRNIIDIFLVK